MKRFNSKRTSGENLNDAVLAILKISVDTVDSVSRDLQERLDMHEQHQLSKMQNELMLFFDFALDYWIQMSVHSQKEQHAIREALSYHWLEAAGGRNEGQAMLDTLQERFNNYSKVVNEEKDDTAKFLGFGKKLSEFCGMTGHPYLLVLAPHLFTVAMESVGVAFCDRGGREDD